MVKVEKDLSVLAQCLLETWNEKQPIPELDRFSIILREKKAVLFILIIRACLAAFSAFHDKIPGAGQQKTVTNFKKVVQNILELLPNSLKVL